MSKELQIIDFLAKINRFSPIEIWYNDGQYGTDCSPSFTTVRGYGDTLLSALKSLLEDLEDYLNETESKEISKILKE